MNENDHPRGALVFILVYLVIIAFCGPTSTCGSGHGKAMKQGATVYLYELAWILPSIAIPVGMLAALLVTAFGAGIHVPSVAGRIDPTRVTETAPFDQPGVVQTGPVSYEVRMIGQIWASPRTRSACRWARP